MFSLVCQKERICLAHLQKQLRAGEMGGLEISCPVARCLRLAIKLLPRSP